jgi:hypothetical protein
VDGNLGVYAGNYAWQVLAYEKWLGREVDSVAVHTGRASWADWDGSISWAIKSFASLARDKTLTIPLISNEGNLAAAAHGDYNSHYLAAAQKLAAAYSNQDVIYVRIGEEFNGGWFPWAAQGHEADYIGAFRQFVDAFRSVSDKFRFEWNVANAGSGMNPATAYPGDQYVDVIGMDFYYNIKWDSPDPLVAWKSMVTRKYGLQWLENFASAHGKPTAYSEWGVNSDNAGPFIQKAQAWFADHHVVYENYWDSSSAFDGLLSSGQYPDAGAAFQAAFGAPPPPPADTTVTPPPPPADTPPPPADTPPPPADTPPPPADTPPPPADTPPPPADTPPPPADTPPPPADTPPPPADTPPPPADTPPPPADTPPPPADTPPPPADTLSTDPAAGDTTYVATSSTSVFIETADGGKDTVKSAFSYTLGPNLEKLILTGSATINGTGNELDNYIAGNKVANVLHGGDGADTLVGGGGADQLYGDAGDDTYILSAGNETVTELPGQGVDTVISPVSYVLPKNVENLILVGGGRAAGFGNELDNRITGTTGANWLEGRAGDDTIDGGAGADTIVGGKGDDQLTGGAGADVFVFARGDGHDVIRDFGVGRDFLDLSSFAVGGKVAATLVAQGADTLISLSSGDSVLLMGVQPGQVHAVTNGFMLA